jgi:CelD/BcsL family acetyltransferase involved in cellulose biosynthesis
VLFVGLTGGIGSGKSETLAAFERLGGPIRRQRRTRPHRRWRLVLPATFDEFLASRSANTRWRLRRDARRIDAAFGGELAFEILREPADFDRLFADVERVARSTYQRALGTGFMDTPERRAVTAVGLERGWVRAYVLYRRADPIAFWVCSLYRGTLLIRQTGYDQQYAELRVGLYLLTRAIEHAISDPQIAVVDFGQGEAAYKQQLGSESFDERDLLLFAPSVRGVRINLTRNAILGAAELSRRAVDAAQLTDRIRTGWRGRLRRRS